MRRLAKSSMSAKCSEINRILRSFNRSENMHLFSTISKNYIFYNDMCEDEKVEYFFKLMVPEKNPNKTYDINEVRIGIYSKKKWLQYGEYVNGDSYECVNYVQSDKDRENWFGSIKAILRDRKLEDILKDDC
jgi:hypothetical protein